MSSTNDTTILAMLSRYPNMSAQEADTHIAKIEHEENIPLCHAILGRISEESLSEDAKLTFNEFKKWSENKRHRVRIEEQHARHRNSETRLANRLKTLHEKGIINEEVLVMYGISGPLPERISYNSLSPEEKQQFWENRMRNTYGENWRNRFSRAITDLPIFNPIQFRENKSREIRNWKLEGF